LRVDANSIRVGVIPNALLQQEQHIKIVLLDVSIAEQVERSLNLPIRSLSGDVEAVVVIYFQLLPCERLEYIKRILVKAQALVILLAGHLRSHNGIVLLGEKASLHDYQQHKQALH